MRYSFEHRLFCNGEPVQAVIHLFVITQSKQANGGHEEGPPEIPDGEIPKSDSTLSLDVPNSITLWTVTPRPSHSPEVLVCSSCVSIGRVRR